MNSTWIDRGQRKVVLNGIAHRIPSYIGGWRTCIINGKVYIDGYELMKDGQWKKTIKAFWYKYFN